MGILGIGNRTENWKTAHTFAPFFSDQDRRLALVRKLGEPKDTKPDDVQLELFWKGMRDHLYQQHLSKRGTLLPDSTIEDFAHHYTQLHRSLGGLREMIENFRSADGLSFESLNSWNYCERPLDHEHEGIDCRRKLAENLMNPEVDIVLETPDHLYIGEAKDESGFDGNGNLVLVHQLIRQYMMARILIGLRGRGEKVVPFIVRNKPKDREPARFNSC